MPSRLGWKMSDWVQLIKSAWYAANAECWMGDDDERESTCHVDARAGDLLYTGVSRESVGDQPGARPSKPGQTLS